MVDQLSPDPGFAFPETSIQAGKTWITELIRLMDLALSKVGAVDDLNQTISATPTQAEVQDISDKVDELLAALRTAGKMES